MTASHTVNGSLSSNAAMVTFPVRFSFVTVTNEDETAGNSIYARTDGVTPVSPWNDCYEISPGETVEISNDGPMWWQGYGGPGGSSDPGTSVILAGVGATSPYEVSGAG